MSRELPVSVQVVTQFPVWMPDGYTKYAGLVESDFVVTFWRDGVTVTQTFMIVEDMVSRGEYALLFTPGVKGYWVVEVKIALNQEVWYEEFDVVDAFAYKPIGVF